MGCHRLLPMEQRVQTPSSRGLESWECQDCWNRNQQSRESTQVMALMHQATRSIVKIATKGAHTKDEQAVSRRIPKILDRFNEIIGGPDELARMLAEDFKRCRGQGMTKEERERWKPNQKVLADYYKLIFKTTSSMDDAIQDEDNGRMSEEDLQRTAAMVAMEMIQNSRDFRRAVIKLISKIDPALIAEYSRDVQPMEAEEPQGA